MAEIPRHFEELSLEKLETFMLKFSDERRTGQLKIQGEGARGGRVDFYGGRVVFVDSPFFSETLGEIARKLGFLDMAEVQRAVDALSRSENAGRQLADILLGEKLVTPEALESCLRYQAESAIHSLIGFHGRISFLPGNVSQAEIALDTREVLRRMKERNHVEEMGSAFLGLTGGTPPTPTPFTPSVDMQAEVKRVLAQKINSALAQRTIKEVAESAAILQAELDAQAAGAAAQLLADADLEEAQIAPSAMEIVAVPESPDRPRLARVVMEICRPGASSTDALLGYAIHFGRRAILFASTSKGLRVAGSKLREGEAFSSEPEGMLLPREIDGALSRVMSERVPARGPVEARDDADKALVALVSPQPAGDTITFPIALHERAIGLLYVDGVPQGDPGVLEGLAAAVSATAVVMENKLVTRNRKS